MFPYTFPFVGVPNQAAAGLDLTADFAILFIGMCVVLSLCILGLVATAAFSESGWVRRPRFGNNWGGRPGYRKGHALDDTTEPRVGHVGAA